MSRWLRRIGYAVGTLVLLVLVLAGFVYAKSSSMIAYKYVPPAESVTVLTDSATLDRGRHMTTVIGKCVECHANDLGGKIFLDDPALGRITAVNLTRGTGGIGSQYSDAQLAIAIRHGIKIDSTSVVMMPSEEYQVLTDADVAAIIAYIRSMPPVDRTLPPTALRALGRALSVAGQLPIIKAGMIAPNRPHLASIAPDTTLEYGAYLANAGGCTGCHSANLSGGKIAGAPPAWPAAANLTPTGIGQFTDAQLTEILHTGTRPDGTHLNDVMPWRYTAKMTDLEIVATIKYLRSVPAREFGVRDASSR